MGNRRTEEEKLLFEKIKKRDPAALSTLYDRYQNLIFGQILNIVKVDSIAEEVMQDVFLTLWKSADKYDPNKGNVFSWVVTVARRKAIDRIRSKNYQTSRHKLDVEQALYAIPAEDMDGLNPQDIVEAQQSRAMVEDALEQIPEEQRTVIKVCFFEGKTHQEVAKMLQIPEGTVKSRMRLGYKKLKDILGQKLTG